MPPPPPRTLTRRRLLRGAGSLAVAAGGATACAAPSSVSSDRTRLRYWHLFGGGDGVNMRAMLDRFEREHPGIGMEVAQLEWGSPYYTKLGMAGAGGRAPEVAVLHLARLPGFAPGRLLDPFDLDLLGEHGVGAQDFPPELWRRGTVEGEQYAVPLDTHPMVLYFHTGICEKAGLLDGEGKLRTLHGTREFTEALRAIKRVTKKPALVAETLGSDAIGPWRIFATGYAQTGGTLFDPTATRLALDDARALRVLAYLRKLGDEGLLVRRADYQGSVGIFNAGDTGFFLNGEWEVSTFQQNKLPFSMTRVPDLFGSRAAQADSHTFVLPHQEGRGGAGNRAAHAFVAWMLKHSVAWAKGGHVPAYLPTLDRRAYRELEPQSEYRDVIDDVALDPPAWFAGSASTMWIELGSVFSGVMTGTRTPRSALEEARSRLRDLLDTPSPMGRA